MKMDYAKDRDSALKNEYPPDWHGGVDENSSKRVAFELGADWAREYLLKDLLNIMNLQIKKDDEIRELRADRAKAIKALKELADCGICISRGICNKANDVLKELGET